jgi:hypothetical protein
MDLATIPSYEAKSKDEESKVIAPEDEEAVLRKELGL